jgi:hypothetical protein
MRLKIKSLKDGRWFLLQRFSYSVTTEDDYISLYQYGNIDDVEIQSAETIKHREEEDFYSYRKDEFFKQPKWNSNLTQLQMTVVK